MSDVRNCSTCRAPIAPGEPAYRCSVSTCNLGKLALIFCSERCFDDHVPTARHKSAKCVPEKNGVRR